jgi:hypothetical protein
VVLDQLGTLFLDQQRGVRKAGSVFCSYFSQMASMDSASMRAWAGS